jgi:hypothetical protein
MKSKKYEIEYVAHSVHEDISKHSRNENNMLGITNFLGLEVYVRELE